MRVLIATLGSAGDVHPMLALAQALLKRGHRVELMTNPVFEPLAKRLGIEFFSLGTTEQFKATVNHPKLWDPIDGLGVMWRGVIRSAILPAYDHIRDAASVGHAVVLASPVVLGARLAQEKLGIPLVTAYTAATMIRSTVNPMSIAQWRIPPWFPKYAREAAWRALDRFKLNPMARTNIDAVRSELGIPPLQGSIFGNWIHSPDAGVTLFPEWFAPRQMDWPIQIQQAGFPVFDGDSFEAADPRLQFFLDSGDAPVVFAPGTAAVDVREFFSAAVSACEVLAVRGVLVCADSTQVPASLPKTICVARYTPFSQLLPRALALVHHGGIGSCAQALHAGIPQVTVPRGYDQFDNTLRLEALSVGTGLSHRGLNGRTIARALDELLRDAETATSMGRLRTLLDASTARNQVCDVVERFQ
jgi:rhamnosyltransferase subunit B